MKCVNESGRELLARTNLRAPANESALRGMDVLAPAMRVVRCAVCGKRIKIPADQQLPDMWIDASYQIDLSNTYLWDVHEALNAWRGNKPVCSVECFEEFHLSMINKLRELMY